ncbi:MAG: alpha-amylase family glycosyl hydrolase, partial [Candidatus Omnitrophica bacterium]|nr:alpha-amylase family glycosyl hydrolase [Candidatus Omnitrophota bacterium]
MLASIKAKSGKDEIMQIWLTDNFNLEDDYIKEALLHGSRYQGILPRSFIFNTKSAELGEYTHGYVQEIFRKDASSARRDELLELKMENLVPFHTKVYQPVYIGMDSEAAAFTRGYHGRSKVEVKLPKVFLEKENKGAELKIIKVEGDAKLLSPVMLLDLLPEVLKGILTRAPPGVKIGVEVVGDKNKKFFEIKRYRDALVFVVHWMLVLDPFIKDALLFDICLHESVELEELHCPIKIAHARACHKAYIYYRDHREELKVFLGRVKQLEFEGKVKINRAYIRELERISTTPVLSDKLRRPADESTQIITEIDGRALSDTYGTIDKVPARFWKWLSGTGFGVIWMKAIWQESPLSGELMQSWNRRHNETLKRIPSGYDVYRYHVNHKIAAKEDDFRKVAKKLNSRNMRVIVDFVTNHIAADSPLIREVPGLVVGGDINKFIQLVRGYFPNWSRGLCDEQLRAFIENECRSFSQDSKSGLIFMHARESGSFEMNPPMINLAQVNYFDERARRFMIKEAMARIAYLTCNGGFRADLAHLGLRDHIWKTW